MDYKKISVSQFENCMSNVPNGNINIFKWLLEEPDCIQLIKEIRTTNDKAVSDMFKKKLTCVTFSGIFIKRNSNGLIEHSGLICIDIDGKDNPETNMSHLKKQLSKLPYVLYAGLSVSGKGVFCLIPIAYPDKHLAHFFALEEDFKAMRINIDPSCKDITRLRFRSFDNKPIINLNATVYGKCADTSSVTRPQKTQNQTATHVPNNSHIQKEEKILSLEDYFLQPTIDVNSNKPIQVFTKNAKEKVKEFVPYIVGEKIDITELYEDWIDICTIIAQTLHEDGRELFHAISQFYHNYMPEECDKKYDDILTRPYKKKVNRLYEIAAKYGL